MALRLLGAPPGASGRGPSTSRRSLVVTLRSTICSPVGVTPGGRVRFSSVGSAPVARPLACGRNPGRRPAPANRIAAAVAVPWAGEPAPWLGPAPSELAAAPAAPPASRWTCPARKRPGRSRQRSPRVTRTPPGVDRLGSSLPGANAVPRNPLTLPESSSPDGLPHPPTRTDGLCPLTSRAVRPNRCAITLAAAKYLVKRYLRIHRVVPRTFSFIPSNTPVIHRSPTGRRPSPPAHPQDRWSIGPLS